MINKMTRIYRIKWFPKKEGAESTRHTLIKISNPTGETSKDAHSAVEIFISSCGNLKKNEIVCIQEFDENKKQIGEDIVPTSTENNIIPISKKN
jgi:hypothetical protein